MTGLVRSLRYDMAVWMVVSDAWLQESDMLCLG